MPLYDYKCGTCEHEEIDVFQKMTSTSPHPCPECGMRMTRVPTLCHTDLKEFHAPIEMYSAALNDDEEIREFKRKCPDVDISTDQRDEMYGIPIARNRRQKLDALRAVGMVEKK